jgi:voltage-gated potassium channel
MAEKNKFINILMLLVMLLLSGTVGYMILLGVPIIDALYMTVITVTTVGFGEVGVMTNGAKLFTIFIIFTSVGIIGYTLTTLTSLFMEGKIQSVDNAIENLNNHYIVCGAGETGQSVISEFVASNTKFVVIDKNEDKVKDLIEKEILAIFGDATSEQTLEKAKVNKAKGLICSLNNDADNVYTVLTARQMNENLYIISRAVDKNSPEKLIKAGANNTISPYEIEGKRMASIALRPTILSFLDVITHAGDVVLDLEDVMICDNSNMIGKPLKDLKIPEKTGLIVIAIQKQGQDEIFFNPSSNEIIQLHDTLIVLGKKDQVNKLRELACDIGDRT